jgi:hypothetical protein
MSKPRSWINNQELQGRHFDLVRGAELRIAPNYMWRRASVPRRTSESLKSLLEATRDMLLSEERRYVTHGCMYVESRENTSTAL